MECTETPKMLLSRLTLPRGDDLDVEASSGIL